MRFLTALDSRLRALWPLQCRRRRLALARQLLERCSGKFPRRAHRIGSETSLEGDVRALVHYGNLYLVRAHGWIFPHLPEAMIPPKRDAGHQITPRPEEHSQALSNKIPAAKLYIFHLFSSGNGHVQGRDRSRPLVGLTAASMLSLPRQGWHWVLTGMVSVQMFLERMHPADEIAVDVLGVLAELQIALFCIPALNGLTAWIRSTGLLQRLILWPTVGPSLRARLASPARSQLRGGS